ncbi:hypothetical protein [Thermorudis peleae]|uniref:hypothetical protein n=1 Tax=Thermorudis peleae TaxID=1382356 RepID=UPI00056E4FDD|nr:hypothetical protein [Thermorudis peleae]
MIPLVSTLSPDFAITKKKRGKICTLAKVVRAWPTGEIVVAMPVKGRHFSTPSLPPEALRLARQAGATAWIVRFDQERRCYRLPLDVAERVGQVGDDGELYVSMRWFERCPWLEWPFVERMVEV